MRNNTFYFLLIVLFLNSCAQRQKEEEVWVGYDENALEGELITTGLEGDSAATADLKRKEYQSTETILTDLIHTKLEVSFDWNNSQLKGKATITAKPHFYPSDSVIFDAKGMDILSIQMKDKKLNFSYDSLLLIVKLDKQYSKNEQFQVTIDYVAKPEDRKLSGSQAITSDKGLYFINPRKEEKNKMPQIWTQGETESSSVWFPTIDSPNSKTSQEIYITVDNKYTTLSNGKLIASTKNTDGTRTDHWKQDLQHAPYLFMMAVGEFKVVKDFYTRLDGTKMEVNYYVEPEWEQYAKAIFGETPTMIKFFSERLGYEYPWDKFHQIVVRDYVSGAMENTGAVIFGDYVYKTDRELLDQNDQSTIAHELFHHWFGDLVTCESWSNLPLNESFANYSQYLWDEFRFGLDEADYQASVEADGYYQSAQVQGYHNLIWFDYDDKEEMFDGHSYNKGGRILHMLRNYLGDEAFFEGLKQYLHANAFKPAEFHQLRLAFEEVSGQDLNWFFEQWFLGSGHPILQIDQDWNKDLNNVTIKVKQNQNLEISPIFKLPVQLAIHDEEGVKIHDIIIDQVDQSFTFPVKGLLKCIVFDNQQMLLAKIKDNKPSEQYIYQYYHTNRYKARKEALMLGTKVKSALMEQLILDALVDPFWNIRLTAIEKSSKLTGENKIKALEIIKELALNDNNSQVRSSALNYVSYNAAESDKQNLFATSIDKDSSYLVITTALGNLVEVNTDLALEKATLLENEPSSSMLAGVAQVYGSHADKEKLTFFESALINNRVHGFDQVSVMNSFTYFIIKQEPEVIDKSFHVFEFLKKDGEYYSQLFLPQNISYLLSAIEEQMNQLKSELEAFEKNNDAALADGHRKKIKLLESIQSKFSSLVD